MSKNKINTELLSAIDVYKLVLSGELKRFPSFFWAESDSIENANEIMRYLIEEILHWTEEDVRKKYNVKTLVSHKLNGMLAICFKHSSFKALDSAYPGKYKVLDMKYVPVGYWNKDNSIEAIREVFDHRLKWSHDDIATKLNGKTFGENGLRTICVSIFNGSAVKAIQTAYPGEFKEWEFKNFRYIDWTKEKIIEAVKWLIEVKLKWSEEEVKKKINNKVFIQNGLYRLIELYDFNATKAVREAYPDKYLPWDFKMPGGYWNEKTAIEAIKWLIEEKLQWSEEDIKNKLAKKVFEDNGLSGMLQVVFKKNQVNAINAAYPGKFKEWEFKNKRIDWTKEKVIEAVKWLIESKLKWSEEEVKQKLVNDVFEQNGLLTLVELYNYSVAKLVMEAYPNKYTLWDFRVRKGYWNEKTGIEATKWLIEEKLQWNEEDIKNKLSRKVFEDNGLSGMLQIVFNGSEVNAINAAYPGKFKEWEFKNKHIQWTKEKVTEAVKWLIESKLKWSKEEVKRNLVYKMFEENGLLNLIELYDYNVGKIVMETYPNQYVPWDFRVPKGYWNLETGIAATKWLVEEKLQLKEEDIKKKLTHKVFRDNGLRGMVYNVFNENLKEAIKAAYPNLYEE